MPLQATTQDKLSLDSGINSDIISKFDSGMLASLLPGNA